MSTASRLAELPVPNDHLRIVVGVDGSEPATRALEWAIGEARRWPAVIDVVTAWTFPMVEGYAFTTSVDDVQRQAREVVDAAMTVVATEAPEVVVRGETAQGEAGPMLVNAARGADLLVVGTQSAGPLKRFFVGSVSAYCTKHATCSVVIVR